MTKKSKNSEVDKYTEDTSFIVQKKSAYLDDLRKKDNKNESMGKNRPSK
jgi:hypothetical protein